MPGQAVVHTFGVDSKNHRSTLLGRTLRWSLLSLNGFSVNVRELLQFFNELLSLKNCSNFVRFHRKWSSHEMLKFFNELLSLKNCSNLVRFHHKWSSHHLAYESIVCLKKYSFVDEHLQNRFKKRCEDLAENSKIVRTIFENHKYKIIQGWKCRVREVRYTER
jgi:hypothetical protein